MIASQSALAHRLLFVSCAIVGYPELVFISLFLPIRLQMWSACCVLHVGLWHGVILLLRNYLPVLS